MTPADSSIVLKFLQTEAHPVPVEDVAEALQALQRGVYQTTRIVREGPQSILQRGPVPHAIKAVATLSIRHVHSSDLTMELVPQQPQQPELDLDELAKERQAALGLLDLCLHAATADEAWQKLTADIEGFAIQKALLSLVSDLAPSTEGGRVQITVGRRPPSCLTSDSPHLVRERLKTPTTSEGWAIGYLSEARVMLHQSCAVRVSDKEVRCVYPIELLEQVRENLGELVAVAGQATYNEEGELQELVAEEIIPVDLSPIIVTEFDANGETVKLREPLHLVPEIDENLLTIDVPELGIFVYGVSSEELIASLRSELPLLWRTYARADNAELDESAMQVKETWLAKVVQK